MAEYDVAALHPGPLDDDAVARAGEDMKMLTDLGFEYVALRGVVGADRQSLRAAAREAGLGVVDVNGVADGPIGQEMRARSERTRVRPAADAASPDTRRIEGEVPTSVAPSERYRISRADDFIKPFDRHAPAGVCVTVRHPATVWDSPTAQGSGPAIRGTMPARRAPLLRPVADGVPEAKPVHDQFGQATVHHESGDRGPAVVDTAALVVPQGQSPLLHLLHRYHVALSNGRTDGLLVRSARRRSDAGGGLIEGSEPLTPAQRTAIESLLGRAGHWGPRIAGLAAEGVSLIVPWPEAVTATLLSGDNVRYLLIHNTSLERYARGRVRISAKMRGEVQRAVEVRAPYGRTSPGLADQSPGRVMAAQQGELSLPVDLRPGDALLYELF